MAGSPDVFFPVAPVQEGLIGLAQACRRLDQRIEHRLQIERRAADDLEHVGGRGLLLERFAQLVEQPRVLDGDDGLRGEVLDQLDLLVGEWPHLLAVDGDRADQLVILEHRHSKQCASAGEFSWLDDGCGLPHRGTASALISATCAICLVSQRHGPGRCPRCGSNHASLTPLRHMQVAHRGARQLRTSPSSYKLQDSESWPRRSASRSPASPRTPASSSPGERLMTFSTSAVAVCCSSDSETHACALAPRRTGARSRSRSPPGRRRSRPARSAYR